MNWLNRLAEDLADAVEHLLQREAARRAAGETFGQTAPSWAGPYDQAASWITPELYQLIQELGQIQIVFTYQDGRLSAAIAPESAPRHYAQHARRQPPPGEPPPGTRTIAKRRLALRALGLADDATPDEIRARYKQLARELHPDRHGGAVKGRAFERMVRVNLAYEYLEKDF